MAGHTSMTMSLLLKPVKYLAFEFLGNLLTQTNRTKQTKVHQIVLFGLLETFVLFVLVDLFGFANFLKKFQEL